MANKPNNKQDKDVKKNSKDKRHFMKDFKAELKKVIWPSPKQLFNNTAAVITIVFIVTIIVLVLDLGFETLNSKGINKLRTIINNETEQVNDVTSDFNIEENNIEENNIVENNIEDENSTETNIENTAE